MTKSKNSKYKPKNKDKKYFSNKIQSNKDSGNSSWNSSKD